MWLCSHFLEVKKFIPRWEAAPKTQETYSSRKLGGSQPLSYISKVQRWQGDPLVELPASWVRSYRDALFSSSVVRKAGSLALIRGVVLNRCEIPPQTRETQLQNTHNCWQQQKGLKSSYACTQRHTYTEVHTHRGTHRGTYTEAHIPLPESS